MAVFAVVFGLLAMFVAQSWLGSQTEKHAKVQPAKAPATRTIVIAAAPLRFGAQLTAQSLREVDWPEAAVPAGTFQSINELLAGGKRMVLAAIAPNEPILAAKVTGAGQRATLSAVIQSGKRAMTVRVNDVEGVAGFVLPGDHVDVLLTRQLDKDRSTTDIVLQHTRVLAVDQLADDSVDKPSVVKAITLEVDAVAAQKLSLAGSVGSLSLALRKAGETQIENTRRISLGDLGNPESRPNEPKRFATVAVTRKDKKQEYNVPAEQHSLETSGMSGDGSR